MNKLTGNSNPDGLCTIVNPFDENSKVTDYLLFASSHPPLPLYDQNGVLVRDSGLVEVQGPVWRYLHPTNGWCLSNWNDCGKLTYNDYVELMAKYGGGQPTEQCYLLTVSQTESDKPKTDTENLMAYKNHPNYYPGYPNSRDSVVSFVLREVAMVIAPPKQDGETHERKCEDIANAILTMENELVDRWNDRYKHFNKTDEPSNYGLPTQSMLTSKEKR